MMTLEEHLVDYLQLRHSLGHELRDAGRLLPEFIAFLNADGLSTVTVESALAWAQQGNTGIGSSVGPRRMTAARGFARYLSGILADTEIPPLGLMPHRRRWPQPIHLLHRRHRGAARPGPLLDRLPAEGCDIPDVDRTPRGEWVEDR